MRPETLTELCERYHIARPADTRGKIFNNFGGFNQVYWAACHCVRTQDDLARLIHEVAEDAALQGAWWIEPAFDADRFSTLRHGDPHQLFPTQEEGWRFALAAAESASRATGVGIGFMSAIDRTMPPEQGLERARITAKLVRTGEHLIHSGMACFNSRYPGIVALGLHGNEEGYPPDLFEEVFQIGAADTGLLSTPHAGEIAPFPGGGPASVTSAIDCLDADRVLHGVLAIEDPALVERLARDGVCLDICPSSNLQLSVFPSIDAHPLPRMMEAGVPCDIGSDDPLLFGPSLLDEYELCRTEMGLSDQLIATLARNSFEHSGAPLEVKAAGVLAVNVWLNGGVDETF
ncbi:MAG: adenosine deaminase family protein [Rhodospirillaceae bacterium]|nr:adenosine deaminase family protein [Rhodospirillaceae bacterium]MBT5108352.1 adenosine deaminase family protein [Rhodospirillaceae bacterium]MBT5667888.1 adenosine deaminase family protein [Rhodospirillaceae bacterium]